MPTGVTLSVIRNRLKAQLGESLSIGTANDALYNQLLVDKQDWFLSEYDWGFLKDHWATTIVANQRYTLVPTVDYLGATVSINMERSLLVETQLIKLWMPVVNGIDATLFNSYNSDDGATADPIRRWQLKDGDATRFEVWPVPATDQPFRFTGQKRVAAPNVASDASTFVIDDLLLVYTVASEILTDRKKPSAQQKAALAERRFNTLKGKDPHALKTFGIGNRSHDERFLDRRHHFNPSAYRVG